MNIIFHNNKKIASCLGSLIGGPSSYKGGIAYELYRYNKRKIK